MGWKQIGGNLGQLVVELAVDSAVNVGVGVGVDGTIWAIIIKITFLHGMVMDVVNKDHIWGVNHIVTNISLNGWYQLVQIPGKFKQVYTSSEKLVVGINYNDQIFQYVNKGWQYFDSALKNVAISIDGIAWGVNGANDIYTRQDNYFYDLISC
ncbi:1865_t:CDS:2 [Entrophospora sp. SA101]|nr:1865_t:CDS:2 [Entrophospora sp. SA101]